MRNEDNHFGTEGLLFNLISVLCFLKTSDGMTRISRFNCNAVVGHAYIMAAAELARAKDMWPTTSLNLGWLSYLEHTI